MTVSSSTVNINSVSEIVMKSGMVSNYAVK
jgi:hypothetical protein